MTAPIALITAGSRGIGATTARLLAEVGYDVAFSYLSNEAAAQTVVDEIEEAGQRALAIMADNAVEADIVRMFKMVERELGVLTALVNNAGVTGGFSRVESVTAETLQLVSDVNFIGSMLCCREAVRRMSTAHGGKGGEPEPCQPWHVPPASYQRVLGENPYANNATFCVVRHPYSRCVSEAMYDAQLTREVRQVVEAQGGAGPRGAHPPWCRRRARSGRSAAAAAPRAPGERHCGRSRPSAGAPAVARA